MRKKVYICSDTFDGVHIVQFKLNTEGLCL